MPKLDKKQWIMVGAAAAAILLVLYLRSRSSSAAASSTPTDTMGTTDGSTGTGSGYADLGGQVQQSAANEASDVASLTGQLQAAQAQESSDIAGLTTAMQDMASATPVDGAAGAPGSPGPSAPATRMSAITNAMKKAGAIALPFGGTNPGGAPKGYKVVGEGGGNWVAVMAGQAKQTNPPRIAHPKTGTKNAKPTAPHTNGNHPAGTGGRAVAPRSHAPARAPTVGAKLSGLHPAVAHPVHVNNPKPVDKGYTPSKPAQKKAPPPKKPAKKAKR